MRSHIIILSTVLAAISSLAPRSYAASIGASGDLYTVEISLTASEPVRGVQLAIDSIRQFPADRGSQIHDQRP